MHASISSKFIEVKDTKIHYLQSGKGDTILLLHGWPTSSYLWRNIIPALSETHQVIAIDLPGFGKSEKRLTDSYSFRYYSRLLDQFLVELKIDQVILGVHDLGGPLGLYWAVQDLGKIKKLILFNTLVYPKFSWAVKLFGLATVLPIVKQWITSPKGIEAAINFGVFDKEKVTEEAIQEYQAPFPNQQSRKTLLKTVQRLSLSGFKEISLKLSSFKGPIQIIFGEKDRILPDVKQTMAKVKNDLPQAKVHAITNAGHFLQEEVSEEIVEVLEVFLSSKNTE